MKLSGSILWLIAGPLVLLACTSAEPQDNREKQSPQLAVADTETNVQVGLRLPEVNQSQSLNLHSKSKSWQRAKKAAIKKKVPRHFKLECLDHSEGEEFEDSEWIFEFALYGEDDKKFETAAFPYTCSGPGVLVVENLVPNMTYSVAANIYQREGGIAYVGKTDRFVPGIDAWVALPMFNSDKAGDVNIEIFFPEDEDDRCFDGKEDCIDPCSYQEECESPPPPPCPAFENCSDDDDCSDKEDCIIDDCNFKGCDGGEWPIDRCDSGEVDKECLFDAKIMIKREARLDKVDYFKLELYADYPECIFHSEFLESQSCTKPVQVLEGKEEILLTGLEDRTYWLVVTYGVDNGDLVKVKGDLKFDPAWFQPQDLVLEIYSE